MNGWRLVADVGGTNVRFARSNRPGHIADCSISMVADYPTFAAALESYLESVGDRGSMREIIIAAAGPHDGDTIALTNASWMIVATEIENKYATPVFLFNDLEAVVHFLPYLDDANVRVIGDTQTPLSGPKIAINVGTGFGAAVLIPLAAGWQAVSCEPGHMTIDASGGCTTAGYAASASVEDLLSGIALSRVNHTPDMIGHRDEFVETLGSVCGNLVLACGAWGGVYLCGSVAQSWLVPQLDTKFRRTFEDKRLMQQRMRRVQTLVITTPLPGLFGLTHLIGGQHTFHPYAI